VAVLDLFRADDDGSVIEIPDTLMAAVLYTPTIDPPTGALDAFLRSGLLASMFNNHRLLEPIGYVPPVEYEEAYYRAQEAQATEPVLN